MTTLIFFNTTLNDELRSRISAINARCGLPSWNPNNVASFDIDDDTLEQYDNDIAKVIDNDPDLYEAFEEYECWATSDDDCDGYSEMLSRLN